MLKFEAQRRSLIPTLIPVGSNVVSPLNGIPVVESLDANLRLSKYY